MKSHKQINDESGLDINLSQHPLLQDDNLNFETIGFDYEDKIYLLSSHADKIDYVIAAGSGLLCGLLDILWVGEFNITRGKTVAKEKIEALSKKLAEMEGWQDAVKTKGKQGFADVLAFLSLRPHDNEDPGETEEFQYSGRVNLSSLPTITGLAFSLLSQLYGQNYFVEEDGSLFIEEISSETKFIGHSISEKIFIGVVDWLFNLASNIDNMSDELYSLHLNIIPVPILELAKNLSQIPLFHDLHAKIKSHNYEKLDEYLNELWNRAREKAIWFSDTKAAGVIFEIGRQSLPVLANDFFVRASYFFRRLMAEVKDSAIQDITIFQTIDWEKISPFNNPTIDRMISISSAVFTGIDLTEAIIKQHSSGKPFYLSINYVGVIKLFFPVKKEIVWALKRRNIKKIKKAFDDVQEFREENEKYERLTCFDLTIEQVEILFNLEYHKTLNDINRTDESKDPVIILQKKKWLEEWKTSITVNYSTFFQRDNISIRWYTIQELMNKVEKKNPKTSIWFSLILLEAMLFSPYYPLNIDRQDSQAIKKYQKAQKAYDEKAGDVYLDSLFSLSSYYCPGKISAFRACYEKYYEKISGNSTRDVIILYSALVITTFSTIFSQAAKPTYFLSDIDKSKIASELQMWVSCFSSIANCFEDKTNPIVDSMGLLLSIRLNTWMDSIILPFGEISKDEVLLLTLKMLVFIEEILIREKKDLDTANKVSKQYHKTESVFKLQVARMKACYKEQNNEDAKNLKLQIKNLEEVIKIMMNGIKCMDEMLL